MREGGNCDFVCLPHDVAGYVPVCQLGAIIEAVQANAWERVCFLCNEGETDPNNKFPIKEETNATTN